MSGAFDRVFMNRMKTIAGTSALDCGSTSPSKPAESVAKCGLNAFQNHKSFFIAYYTSTGDVLGYAYGLAADPDGNVFAVMYQGVRSFPAVAPKHHMRLADESHTRIAECVRPVKLGKDSDGVLSCLTPINREESEKVAHQTPVNTTLCAVIDNPPAFNNRLVRIRGSYSGNFEYSMLSAAGCKEALWFGYGGGGAPPSLAAFVGGGAMPGSEDADGKLILPVPVKVVRDSKFERFEKEVQAMAHADANYEKEHPGKFIDHCVTATFLGRIDSVSPEVHEYRKKNTSNEHSDGLGFGQMGLFEAQFILHSVVDDATLGACSQ